MYLNLLMMLINIICKMKYIKTFENLNLNNQPKVGDYVYVNTYYADDVIINFLNNNIGKIIRRIDRGFVVKYDNAPDEFNIESENHDNNLDYCFSNNNWNVDYDEIIAFAPTKKELELKIQSNKYNL